MPFLSQIIGNQVVDYEGEKIGRVKDVLAIQKTGLAHPLITAIEIGHRDQLVDIAASDIANLFAPVISLNKLWANVTPYQPTDQDRYLARDVLDKQIIDVNGVRVVRVNDLDLVRNKGEIYIANVDISGSGLMRRLGVSKAPSWLGGPSKGIPNAGFISWDAIDLIDANQPMRLKVAGDKIADLHPADLAEILSDLTRTEGSRLLGSLDVELMADTLEEVEPEFQASLVEDMPNEQVADVLEEMSPDEAADLLAELPEDRSEELLGLMQKDEAEDVRKLLAYPEDSAGGIMNTEYVAVPADLTAAEVIDRLRETSPEAETIYYIYVVDSPNHLIGVFSLRRLVLERPKRKVSDFMETRLVTVKPSDTQEDVAHIVAKYNLLSVPVVDEGNTLLGMVTADDALDKILPTAWKKRLPRFYH
jgi:CBS domain-containing protein/sporulation protein YlmC with PRC-barrel domain